MHRRCAKKHEAKQRENGVTIDCCDGVNVVTLLVYLRERERSLLASSTIAYIYMYKFLRLRVVVVVVVLLGELVVR